MTVPAAASLSALCGVRLLIIPVHQDQRGALVSLESETLPFPVQRTFCIFDCPVDASRGSHAASVHEAILALSGSVTVDLNDGVHRATILLDDPRQVLCIHAGLWLRLGSFTANSIVVVAASNSYAATQHFDEPNRELLAREDWR